MLVLVRGENRSIRGKTSQCKVENQRTQPTYDEECRSRTRLTSVNNQRNLLLSILLNQWLVLTMLGAIAPRWRLGNMALHYLTH